MKSGLKNRRHLIGGEFEIDELRLGLADRVSELTGGMTGTWSISGRTALAMVLEHLQSLGVRHIHLPAYLCNSIMIPIIKMGWDYSFYPVDYNLAAQPNPPPNAAVLLIHYFGWINPATKALRTKAGNNLFLIEDASHAFLSKYFPISPANSFIIMSYRKLAPIPLGGWCNLSVDLPDHSEDVKTLVMKSILARLVRGTYLSNHKGNVDCVLEDFYLSIFNDIENYFDNHIPLIHLPEIVFKIMTAVDWGKISEKRRRNWKLMRTLLKNAPEPLFQDLPDNVVPVNYVIRSTRRDDLRSYLASKRMFCPIHWTLPPEVPRKDFPIASELSETCLSIPIDQRYDDKDITTIANVIREFQ